MFNVARQNLEHLVPIAYPVRKECLLKAQVINPVSYFQPGMCNPLEDLDVFQDYVKQLINYFYGVSNLKELHLMFHDIQDIAGSDKSKGLTRAEFVFLKAGYSYIDNLLLELTKKLIVECLCYQLLHMKTYCPETPFDDVMQNKWGAPRNKRVPYIIDLDNPPWRVWKVLYPPVVIPDDEEEDDGTFYNRRQYDARFNYEEEVDEDVELRNAVTDNLFKNYIYSRNVHDIAWAAPPISYETNRWRLIDHNQFAMENPIYYFQTGMPNPLENQEYFYIYARSLTNFFYGIRNMFTLYWKLKLCTRYRTPGENDFISRDLEYMGDDDAIANCKIYYGRLIPELTYIFIGEAKKFQMEKFGYIQDETPFDDVMRNKWNERN